MYNYMYIPGPPQGHATPGPADGPRPRGGGGGPHDAGGPPEAPRMAQGPTA